MCFAPQRRALFRHLKCQKWSAPLVLCTFWLGNVLRATTACTFSTSQLPKVVREWCVLYISNWKSASRHNGVQFFISHLASWLPSLRSRNAFGDLTRGTLYAKFRGKMPGSQGEQLDQAPALTLTIGRPQCGHTCWGKTGLLGHQPYSQG